MSSFPIKTGDRLPRLRYELRNGDGTQPDLTGASVVFNMDDAQGAKILTRAAATIVSTSPPVVEYAWAAGDTTIPGLHNAEFEVTFPGGLPATYPNRGYIQIEIGADLG